MEGGRGGGGSMGVYGGGAAVSGAAGMFNDTGSSFIGNVK